MFSIPPYSPPPPEPVIEQTFVSIAPDVEGTKDVLSLGLKSRITNTGFKLKPRKVLREVSPIPDKVSQDNAAPSSDKPDAHDTTVGKSDFMNSSVLPRDAIFKAKRSRTLQTSGQSNRKVTDQKAATDQNSVPDPKVPGNALTLQGRRTS